MARILYAEDDSLVSSLYVEVLEMEGHEVHLAENGQEGLDTLDEMIKEGNNPDLILTDVIMPGMSGSEFITLVMERYEGREKPKVIIYSGYSADTIPEGTDRYAFLQKPFKNQELTDLIKQVLGEEEPPSGGFASAYPR